MYNTIMINLNVRKKLKTSKKSQEKSHGKYKPWGKKPIS